MPSVRSATKVLLPLALLAVAATGFAWFKSTRPSQPAPHVPAERSWIVDTVVARPASLGPSLTLYGTVEAPTLWQASAPGAGVVASVHVRDGQRVRQGDELLTLDRRDFVPAVEQAQANVLDLEAQLGELELRSASDRAALAEEQRLLELARKTVARARQLRRQQLGAESTLDDTEQALGRQQLALTARQLSVDSSELRAKQLRARLRSFRAQLAQAQLALARSRVVAAFDGVISAVNAAAGDRVQASQELLSLYPPGELEIRARVPARYQAELQNALDAGATLLARTHLDDEPLTLLRLAGVADPSGIDAFFRVVGASHPLRPGNLVELVLARPAQDAVLAVPYPAIYGNNRLFVLRDGRMQGVDVEAIGSYADGDGGELLLVRSDAITAGEHIIVTHLPNAVSGLKVLRAGAAAGGG